MQNEYNKTELDYKAQKTLTITRRKIIIKIIIIN